MSKMDGKDESVESQVSRVMNGHILTEAKPINSNSLAERLALLGVSTDAESVSENDGVSVDLELEDFSEETAGSEYSYEEEINDRGVEEHGRSIEKCDKNGTMDLVPLDDNVDEIDSEEERDIMKEIREEIQNKVRSEMKDEIQMYKSKIAAIEQGELPGDEERRERKEEEENLDPLIQEALLKMRKLDRILSKKMRREREVKRDRILLEKRIREEINSLKPEGREHKDVKTNTDKFVSLALPPSHNEGVQVEPDPPTPVFQTQLNENEFPDQTAANSGRQKLDEDQETSTVDGETSNRLGGDRKTNKKKKRKKDFIKRNKELAANADEMIAMTEEERTRVGQLLTDLDAMPELQEDMENDDVGNPFQMLPIRLGEGYCGDEQEMLSLARIDGRLKDLLPEEDFQSLMSTTPYNSARDSEIETPTLTENSLKDLLDQCVRSLSRTSYADESSMDESTPRSEMSSVVSILENPPRLSDEVLQQLLAEAHFPLSSKLEAVREEEGKYHSDGEQDEPPEKILAETWKAIAESEAYEDCSSDNLDTNSVSQSWSHSTNDTLRSSETWQSKYSRQSDYLDNDKNRLILPEISQSPFLVSQGLNNQISKNETYHRQNPEGPLNSRNIVNMVRNNLSEVNDDSIWKEDIRDSVMTPRPPSSERLSSAEYVSRSRTVTPFSQS